MLRHELWTLPWDAGGFKRVVAKLPVVEGSSRGSVYFQSAAGEGSAGIYQFDRIDEVVSDTVGRLIRVYDGSTLINEWIPERTSWSHDDDDRIAQVSGPSLVSAFEKWVLYPFDYPKSPTLDPDWIWGSEEDLIENGDFESLNFLENEGFEEGEIKPWWAGNTEGVSANAAIETTEVDTGSFSMKVTPLQVEGGASTSVSGLHQFHDYTISARIKATAGVTLQLAASGESGMVVVTGNRVVEHDLSPGGYEAQVDLVASGNWETIQLVFRAAAGQDSSQISIRQIAGTLADFFVDVVTVSGQGVGAEGWQMHPWDGDVLFTASSEVPANTGSFTLKVNAPDAQGVFTGPIPVQKGATYTITAWVRTLSGTALWELSVIDELYRRIGNASVVASTTWQKLEITGVVSDQFPGDREIFVGINNISGGQATAYFDTISVVRGRPKTTVGDMVIEVMDDVTLDHAADPRGVALTWVDYSSLTDALDSGGNAWAANVAANLPFGMTYGQIWDVFSDLGYEWELVAKAVPSGALTHDLRWYNPAGRDDAPSTAISPKQGVTGGSVVKRIPGYTSVIVEGKDGLYLEDVDATAETNFGHTERFLTAREIGDLTTLGTTADEALDFELTNRKAVQFEITAGPNWPRPLVSYKPGDTIPMQLPPGLPREYRRVQRIDYMGTEPTQYVVVGSRVLLGEAGGWELVRRMWRAFKRRDKDTIHTVDDGGGGGVGAPTIFVAASDATPQSKTLAHFRCNGTNDHEVIMAAISALSAVRGGRVLLSEGSFFCQFGQLAWDVARLTLQGLGRNTTVLNFFGGSGDAISLSTSAQYNTIRDLAIFGPGSGSEHGIAALGQTLTVRDCLIQSIGGNAIHASGFTRLWLLDNWVDDIGGVGISLNGITQALIRGNQITRIQSHGITLTGAQCEDVIVSGNLIQAAEDIGTHGINIEGSLVNSKIVINIIEGGGHGISATNMSLCRVLANQITAALFSVDNTYDSIILSGDSDDNYIHNNMMIGSPSSPKPRYGINISVSTCENNIVVGNSFGPASNYGTDPLLNLGTDTELFYPANPTYGDNFVIDPSGGGGATPQSKSVVATAETEAAQSITPTQP